MLSINLIISCCLGFVLWQQRLTENIVRSPGFSKLQKPSVLGILHRQKKSEHKMRLSSRSNAPSTTRKRGGEYVGSVALALTRFADFICISIGLTCFTCYACWNINIRGRGKGWVIRVIRWELLILGLLGLLGKDDTTALRERQALHPLLHRVYTCMWIVVMGIVLIYFSA